MQVIRLQLLQCCITDASFHVIASSSPGSAQLMGTRCPANHNLKKNIRLGPDASRTLDLHFHTAIMTALKPIPKCLERK